MKATLVVDITADRIADLIVGAVEGGSNYWCASLYLRKPASSKGLQTPWYSDPKLYDMDFLLVALEDGETTERLITPESMAKGIAIMGEKYPWHLANIVNESDDAGTADVFLQLVALGEVVYG